MLLFFASSAGAGHKGRMCSTPREMTRFKVQLPNTARAVRAHGPLGIVAIGSSSTAGAGASDPAHAYPALLGQELQQRWPRIALTVTNKGIGGELAAQMLARFERDVLPYRPQLVIWQTGSNHLLKSENVDGYAETLREGISRLKAAHADVVLMDPQFAPSILARRNYPTIVDSIAAVANDTHVALFPRFKVMQHWVSSGQYKIPDIISSDELHMNDVSYACIARLLADSLTNATGFEPGQRPISDETKQQEGIGEIRN
jgi:lysophospholipase L1-like esterase